MIYTSNFSLATEQCHDFTAIALRSPENILHVSVAWIKWS
jgi:hypothetical protein